VSPPRIDPDRLLRIAREARRRAYAPYSKYKVGAALLGASGRVYPGCNVENASYGLCLCAERNAFGSGVAAGDRRFIAIAITASGPDPVPPCGMCRQVIAELMAPSAPVIAENQRRRRTTWTAAELLPDAFTRRFF
jgi:cytidine deaminase